jgi:uncharacterized protein (DUF1778 family)
MPRTDLKRDTTVSMRLEKGDLRLIDRGAKLSGLSRTEFMRRAALNETQSAILSETMPRLSTDAWREFCAAIEAPITAPPGKLAERLNRAPPWRVER